MYEAKVNVTHKDFNLSFEDLVAGNLYESNEGHVYRCLRFVEDYYEKYLDCLVAKDGLAGGCLIVREFAVPDLKFRNFVGSVTLTIK